MKIAIINRSDLNGGAAVFTYRLMKAFRNQGIDASMLVTDKLSNDNDVVSYADTHRIYAVFIVEFHYQRRCSIHVITIDK